MMVKTVDTRPFISPLWDKIKVTDVIRQVNERPIKTQQQFARALLSFRDTVVTLTVQRFRPIAIMTLNRCKLHNVSMTSTVSTCLEYIGLSYHCSKRQIVLLKFIILLNFYFIFSSTATSLPTLCSRRTQTWAFPCVLLTKRSSSLL